MLEENWEAVNLFLRLSTQWKCSQGAMIGLNYQSVEFFFRLFKVKNRADVLMDIQVMEFEALRIINNKE